MKHIKSGYKKYNSEDKKFEEYIKLAEIKKEDKEILREYFNDRSANGLKKRTTNALIGTLITLFEQIPCPIKDKGIREHLKSFFINQKLKPTTELWYKKSLKRFYTWLSNYKDDVSFLGAVNWINYRQLSSKCSQSANHKREQNLISPEDVRKILGVCSLNRDKLAIALLADTGLRAESIGASHNQRSINVGQVKFFKNYAVIEDIEEKFDKKRQAIVTEALPYLIKYWNELSNEHKNNKDNPLFISYSTNKYGERWGYSGLKFMLHKLSKKALGRIVNPHDFRHFKGTRLTLDDGLSDDSKMKLMGWNSRRMLDRYSHITLEDAKTEYLDKKGIIKIEKGKNKVQTAILKPKQCVFCKSISPDTDKICESCGADLDYDKIIKQHIKNKGAEEKLSGFVDKESIQKLFKTMEKLQKQINKLKK